MDANKKICVDEIVIEFMRSLKAEREKRGFTMRMLAEKAGCGESTLAHYEDMSHFPRTVGILMRLSEALGYDISGSINYRYYHGQIDIAGIRERIASSGLTVSEIENRAGCDKIFTPGGEDIISLNALSSVLRVLDEAERLPPPSRDLHAHKFICRDEVTLKFLRSVKSERLRKGLRIKELARMLGVSRFTVMACERGRWLPELPMLIKLAEILGCDISGSVNYKYYHGEISPRKIKSQLSRYGLTQEEIGRLTGYSEKAVRSTLSFRKGNFSLDCLNAILEVLAREQSSFEYRRELLRRKAKAGRRVYHRRSRANLKCAEKSAVKRLWSWPF